VQDDLQEIFARLRTALSEYSPPLAERTARAPGKDSYELWSELEVEIEGRKRDELFFAGLIVQKGYVGFYFMPVYSDPEKTELFHPELLKLLKGKSCFHVRRLDDELDAHIRDALHEGFELWRRRGWILAPG
jgi:hypothetical protein